MLHHNSGCPEPDRLLDELVSIMAMATNRNIDSSWRDLSAVAAQLRGDQFRRVSERSPFEALSQMKMKRLRNHSDSPGRKGDSILPPQKFSNTIRWILSLAANEVNIGWQCAGVRNGNVRSGDVPTGREIPETLRIGVLCRKQNRTGALSQPCKLRQIPPRLPVNGYSSGLRSGKMHSETQDPFDAASNTDLSV